MSINQAFKALSDPTRRTILDLLRDRDMTAGEIADHFQMTKPSISHHLNLLKQAELVRDERKGQHIFYSLNTTVFHELMKWFLEFQQPNKTGKDDSR
ncbi:autorepressor SdpR family transcription factor [Paenibacillus thermoaerophilus]|uniref:Autorepressor SdpR family transcription factor n=1 Tax=Paenibacillus thermoaerophilus TaxID=1215385 RepID=A0ABW2V3E0_9BACL|nr:autorepressor SdpR family transcription factor [Paenibacillus thermoaerophilus]TMV08244.1 winged helix-turn-helix transcriptional regulator [Paenibacillus thermoaerophilus]